MSIMSITGIITNAFGEPARWADFTPGHRLEILALALTRACYAAAQQLGWAIEPAFCGPCVTHGSLCEHRQEWRSLVESVLEAAQACGFANPELRVSWGHTNHWSMLTGVEIVDPDTREWDHVWLSGINSRHQIGLWVETLPDHLQRMLAPHL